MDRKDGLEELLEAIAEKNKMDDMTELEEYQEFVEEMTSPLVATSIENLSTHDMYGMWAAMGIITEAGEVLEIFEKAVRKGREIDRDKVLDELGDVLWNIAACANAYGVSLDEVILHNIDKLNKRKVERDQITR